MKVIKLVAWSYAVGLIIYIVLLFTPFALAVVWPLGMLPLLLPLAGCWGVIPYPVVEYLVMSHTTGVEGLLALISYYVVLISAIACQLLILIKLIRFGLTGAKRILNLVSTHHLIVGISLFAFFCVYVPLRDSQSGINVFSANYLFLALLGVYGFLINYAVFSDLRKVRIKIKKIKKEK